MITKIIYVPDAGFISTTLTKVTRRSRRNTLQVERALMRVDSPERVRKSKAHQFVYHLSRTSDSSLQKHVRDKAAAARRELHAFTHLFHLVPDIDRTFQPRDIVAAREDESEREFEGKRRKPPPKGRGTTKLTWGLPQSDCAISHLGRERSSRGTSLRSSPSWRRRW